MTVLRMSVCLVLALVMGSAAPRARRSGVIDFNLDTPPAVGARDWTITVVYNGQLHVLTRLELRAAVRAQRHE